MAIDTGPDINTVSGRAPAANLTDKLLIDVVELAWLTSLSVRTLRRMDASQDIPGRVVVRRCVRFQTEIVRAWIQAGLPGREKWEVLQKEIAKQARRRGIPMASFQWVSVKLQVPCPICKEARWCSLSVDGTIVKCMRIAEGCFKSKIDKNGTPFHLHRLTQDVRPDAAQQTSATSLERADADTLNQIYGALLDRLILTTTHRDALKSRGLPDDAIAKNAYRSLPIQGRLRIVAALKENFADKLLRKAKTITSRFQTETGIA